MILRLPVPLQRLLAGLLAVAALALGPAVSVLDAEEGKHGPVMESAHDAAECVHGHDHSICTQVGANVGRTTVPPRHGLGADHRREPSLLARDVAAPTAPLVRPVGSRAPPLA